MRRYCINCGHGNEYSGTLPEKCEKCKKDMAIATIILWKENKDKEGKTTSVETERIKVTPVEELNDRTDFEDSKFDSFMEEAPEEISEDEISRIFLANANRGVKLDFMKQKESKKKEREPRSKPIKPKTQKSKAK